MKNLKRIFMIFCFYILVSQSQVFATTFFIDIWQHWAEEIIMWATNDVPLFSGYEDGTFKPDDPITRAEYISILQRAASETGLIKRDDTIEIIDESKIVYAYGYEDVSQNFWAYNEIKTVFDYIQKQDTEPSVYDIFEGNLLNPNKPITREEAILLSSYFVGPSIENKILTFTDLDVNYKYSEAIRTVVNNKIVQGDTNRIELDRNITRAESAALIQRLYKEMNLISIKPLNGIEVIANIYDKKYDYFGDYLSSESTLKTEMDERYSKAINTLEYLAIIKNIPYSERELYDADPLQTLRNLRTEQYWNVVGLNYYLIRYELYEDEKEKTKLMEELLTSYLNQDILDYQQGKILAEGILKEPKLTNNEILGFINKWGESAQSEEEQLNILFYKTKFLLEDKIDYEKILSYYNVLEQSVQFKSLESYKYFVNNKVYLLKLQEKYDEAIEYFKNGQSNVKNYTEYLSKKEELEVYFDSGLKQLLLEQNILISEANEVQEIRLP
ncbi:MAG: S-layer homology domain-containing protein [Tissierellales bacterium]|jgi:hypothetical protein|nr:S-layer homology domain-containing protein [Tissierellales bacterium]